MWYRFTKTRCGDKHSSYCGWLETSFLLVSHFAVHNIYILLPNSLCSEQAVHMVTMVFYCTHTPCQTLSTSALLSTVLCLCPRSHPHSLLYNIMSCLMFSIVNLNNECLSKQNFSVNGTHLEAHKASLRLMVCSVCACDGIWARSCAVVKCVYMFATTVLSLFDVQLHSTTAIYTCNSIQGYCFNQCWKSRSLVQAYRVFCCLTPILCCKSDLKLLRNYFQFQYPCEIHGNTLRGVGINV